MHPVHNALHRYLLTDVINVCNSFMLFDLCDKCGEWHPRTCECLGDLFYCELLFGEMQFTTQIQFRDQNEQELWGYVLERYNPQQRKMHVSYNNKIDESLPLSCRICVPSNGYIFIKHAKESLIYFILCRE